MCFEARFSACPIAANLPGWAGVAARPAVRRIGLKVGADAVAAALTARAGVATGAAVQRVGLNACACAIAAGLPGRAGMTTGSAMRGIGFEIGAGAAATGFAVVAGAAIERPAATVRGTPALIGLAGERRATDALVADLARGTGDRT